MLSLRLKTLHLKKQQLGKKQKSQNVSRETYFVDICTLYLWKKHIQIASKKSVCFAFGYSRLFHFLWMEWLVWKLLSDIF